MPLIQCSECHNQVFDPAAQCSKCGHRIASAKEPHEASVRLVTIQEMSKKLKIHFLISALLISFGLIAAAKSVGNEQTGELGGLMMMSGIVWYVVTRVRRWWHRG